MNRTPLEKNKQQGQKDLQKQQRFLGGGLWGWNRHGLYPGR